MIIEAVAEYLMDFLLVVLDALPEVDLTIPSFGPMVGLAKSLDGFLPVSEILDFLLTGIRVLGVLLAFRLVIFLYGLIPFKAS